MNKKWDKWYETEYWINGEKHVYVTKTLTNFHYKIYERAEMAFTYLKDTTVDWPFGLYSEIIKQKKPQK